MISESERRKVAERLRMCARETNGKYDFTMYLNHWVGIDGVTDDEGKHFSVGADRRCAEMTLEKLADLIDPTCHLRPAHFGGFGCDRCFTWFPDMKKRTSYCPECGARVVDDE